MAEAMLTARGVDAQYVLDSHPRCQATAWSFGCAASQPYDRISSPCLYKAEPLLRHSRQISRMHQAAVVGVVSAADGTADGTADAVNVVKGDQCWKQSHRAAHLFPDGLARRD